MLSFIEFGRDQSGQLYWGSSQGSSEDAAESTPGDDLDMIINSADVVFFDMAS